MDKRKQPLQQRSIEKRDLILRCGFTLMMQKGYHNTTTDDIAKEAGISTGIIYRYFSNKKELLLAALNMFTHSMEATYFKFPMETGTTDTKELLTLILNRFITLHTENKTVHEEMEALCYSDPDIARSYSEFGGLLYSYMANFLPKNISNAPHAKEKIWMVLQLMEGYCHALIRSVDTMDFPYLKNQVLEQSVLILQ